MTESSTAAAATGSEDAVFLRFAGHTFEPAAVHVQPLTRVHDRLVDVGERHARHLVCVRIADIPNARVVAQLDRVLGPRVVPAPDFAQDRFLHLHERVGRVHAFTVHLAINGAKERGVVRPGRCVRYVYQVTRERA